MRITDSIILYTLRPEQTWRWPPSAPTRPVILDEVQKVPAVLDEVHWLIENRGLRFILCGSSARKLKRGQANLLGGRAQAAGQVAFTSPDKTTCLVKVGVA